MAQGFNAGTVYATLQMNEGNWHQQLAKANNAIDQAARYQEQRFKRIREATDKVANGFLSVGAIAAVGLGGMVKAAQDTIESENLVSVSLGKNEAAVRAWSQSLRKELGLNEYELRKNTATFYTMFDSMKMGEKASLEMSKGLSKLAYDMASFYNTSPEEAFEKLRAGITGEVEPLKRLGIIVNETTTKTYAYKNGIAQAGAVLTEQQKVLARYAAIMDQTSKAQGDLARTIDSPTNKLRMQGEAAKQTAVDLGMALMPVYDKLLSVTGRFANTLNGMSKEQKDSTANLLLWGTAGALATGGTLKAGLAITDLTTKMQALNTAGTLTYAALGRAGIIIGAVAVAAYGLNQIINAGSIARQNEIRAMEARANLMEAEIEGDNEKAARLRTLAGEYDGLSNKQALSVGESSRLQSIHSELNVLMSGASRILKDLPAEWDGNTNAVKRYADALANTTGKQRELLRLQLQTQMKEKEKAISDLEASVRRRGIGVAYLGTDDFVDVVNFSKEEELKRKRLLAERGQIVDQLRTLQQEKSTSAPVVHGPTAGGTWGEASSADTTGTPSAGTSPGTARGSSGRTRRTGGRTRTSKSAVAIPLLQQVDRDIEAAHAKAKDGNEFWDMKKSILESAVARLADYLASRGMNAGAIANDSRMKSLKARLARHLTMQPRSRGVVAYDSPAGPQQPTGEGLTISAGTDAPPRGYQAYSEPAGPEYAVPENWTINAGTDVPGIPSAYPSPIGPEAGTPDAFVISSGTDAYSPDVLDRALERLRARNDLEQEALRLQSEQTGEVKDRAALLARVVEDRQREIALIKTSLADAARFNASPDTIEELQLRLRAAENGLKSAQIDQAKAVSTGVKAGMSDAMKEILSGKPFGEMGRDRARQNLDAFLSGAPGAFDGGVSKSLQAIFGDKYAKFFQDPKTRRAIGGMSDIVAGLSAFQTGTTSTSEGAFSGAAGGLSLASGLSSLGLVTKNLPGIGIAASIIGAFIGAGTARKNREEATRKWQEGVLRELQRVNNKLTPVSDYYNRGGFGAVAPSSVFAGGSSWAGLQVSMRRGFR